MSLSHVYYTNGKETCWIKLEKPRRDQTTLEPIYDCPQQVFGLSEYVFLGESYATRLEHPKRKHEHDLELPSREVLLTIAQQPKPGMGFNDCILGIKIIHSKAEEFFRNRIQKLIPNGPELKISDDLSALTLDDEQPFNIDNILHHAYFLPPDVDLEYDLDAAMEEVLDSPYTDLLLVDIDTKFWSFLNEKD